MADLIQKNNEPFVPEPKGGNGSDIIAIVFLVAALACCTAFLFTSKTVLLAAGAVLFIISTVIFLANRPQDRHSTYTPGKFYGDMGERRAGSILETYLPDDCTVIQNARVYFDGKTSEIDNIVIGSSGVFIVEVKNMKGRIYGDYNEQYWLQDKIDQYDIEHKKEFYSPVKQVGTHIYRLANFLRDNKIFTNISGAVYFTNPQASVRVVGEQGNIPVFSFHSTQKLIEYINSGDSELSEDTIKRIIEVLK